MARTENDVRGAFRRRVGRLSGMILAAMALLCGYDAAQAQGGGAREYQIKAIFLAKFAGFVTWPPNAFAGANAPIVIGVLGDDPFGAHLDDAIRGERVGGRSFVARRFASVAEARDCHILFVSSSEKRRIGGILEQIRGKSILTVGETRRFAHEGGMINFVLAANKVRFEINPAAAKRERLSVSSKLLRLGTLVDE